MAAEKFYRRKSALDTRRFRDALGQFPTGVTIITTMTAAGDRLGMTISSSNSLSLDPPLVLFSIWCSASSFAAWQQAERYAINVLNENQEELSNKFARARGEKWIGQTVLTGKTGAPLLLNAVIAFECEAHDRYDGGDHEIFVGRVVELHENQVKRGHPLVFFGGQYRCHGPVEANAPADIVNFLHGW
jgi:flavin reductase (DIM6/NTAB) family NADH-FMN oxidoreductase RutF